MYYDIFMKRNKLFILAFIAFSFLLIRLPGLSLPYHQDEWKTVHATDVGGGATSFLFHPPLTQWSFLFDHAIFGSVHMRMFPLLISFLTALLLYYVVSRRYGHRVGLFSLALFSVCFYSVLASLMIDTDGALLPFFFISSLFLYDLYHTSKQRRWLVLFFLSLLLGFLVKLSFVIVVGVFICDASIRYRKSFSSQYITRAVLFGLAFATAFSVLLILAKLLYPSFQIEGMAQHAFSYVHFSDRNYTQIFVQLIKSLEYTSPLLLVPLLLLTKKEVMRLRIWILYLILGSVFYFVLFDFSRGALDKYLMFSIVPLCVLAGSVYARLSREYFYKREHIVYSLIVGGLLFTLQFFSHQVLALYPKTEWFSRVFSGQWNMLIPFTGGSGPLGFYVSFLFLLSIFIVSFLVVGAVRVQKISTSLALLLLFTVGLLYNGIFAEEFLFGKINGSAPVVLDAALSVIKNDPSIQGVITYNDIGAYELTQLGKYKGRFYAAPENEEHHRVLFKNFSGYILVVDIPRLYDGGVYREYLNSCIEIFHAIDKRIPVSVYDCRHSL